MGNINNGSSEIERYLLELLGSGGIGPGAVKKDLGKIQASLSASDVFQSLAPVIGQKADEASRTAALTQPNKALDRCTAVGITAMSTLAPEYPRAVWTSARRLPPSSVTAT